MKSGYDVWSYVSDSYSDCVTAIQETVPGGLWSCFGLTIATYILYKYLASSFAMGKTRKMIAQRRKLNQEIMKKMRDKVERGRGLIDLSIAELSFNDLRDRLKSGKLSCRQVLLSYQAKAFEVHDKTNCITEFVEEAEELAIQLDKLKPEERGLLHGIPISMKEVVGVKGQDCTAGLTCYIGQIHDDYGVMVKVLMKHGAIPFARTNISQGQIGINCNNPIWGESTNPHNTKRTCGASSGGEGAIVGGGGSIMGIACDMGGSTRMPSHFCGCCGLRPTGNRMSNAGNLPFGHGVMTIQETYGPVGRDVDTLVTFLNAALDPEMYRLDPLIPQIPWRDEMYKSKKPMVVGYYLQHGGGVEPVPSVKRAILMAKATLERMGHTVVEFDPPDAMYTVMECLVSAMMCDDGMMFGDVTKNEVMDPSMYIGMKVQNIPWIFRNIMAKMMYMLHPVERSMVAAKSNNHVYSWWQRNELREHLRLNYIKKMQERNIEAVICPVFPYPAWPLDDYSNALAGATYTMIYNALDFPAGVVPVTTVTAEDVKNIKSYSNKYMTDKYIRRITEGSEGLPVAVQVASVPYHEEVVMKVMKEIETGLKK